MIARMWRSTATEEGTSRYLEYFNDKVLVDLRAVAGFLSVDVLVHSGNELNEIVVITKWESEDSVRQFSGPDTSIANVEPEAIMFLRSFDTEVTHFSVELESNPAGLGQNCHGA